ncbi:hypothetical protein BH11MYX1_BH11MYX1_44210 [soil metagenome]
MNRLALGLALTSSLFATYAHAETQAEIAAAENEEGKNLMFAGNYKGASDKFRSAADRANEPKYFFNLCTSLYQQGIFGAALTACNAADTLSPDPKLKEKIQKTQEKIKSDAGAQHIDLAPTGTGGGAAGPETGNGGTTTMGQAAPPPTNGQPPTLGGGPASTPQYAVGRPTQNLIVAVKPEQTYVWTLGIDLFGGGGRVGQQGAFGQASGGFRLKGDYMVNPAAKFGIQSYFQVTHFGQGNMDTLTTTSNTLDVLDIGLAAYKHVCAKSLCLTPLAGIEYSLMSPANQNDGAGSQVFNYAALGARVEVALSYAFGTHLEHVLSAELGANLYTAVFSEPQDGTSAAAYGLDVGGAAGYFGLGYTYRFNTPFGSAPFVSLE